MTALRVVTVDDEPLARERVAALITATEGLELAGEARNGVEALDLIAAVRPDLALIDVEMPGLSGLAVVAALEADRAPGIIFVTAYDQYAVQAFELDAIDYLLKPVTRARFTAAIERAGTRLARAGGPAAAAVERIQRTAASVERRRGPRTRYAVRVGHRHYILPVAEIDWLEAADNYLRLHAGGRVHLVRGTIRDAERELDAERFVRIHRSTLVAADRITSVGRAGGGHWLVGLAGGQELRVSRTYADAIRRLLRPSAPPID